MVKVALVVSIIALAVCLLTALHGVLSDGLKGLKQRSKPISISFLIYVLIFIRDGKIIKIVENDYNEKELEALYEDIMTSGQREEA